ncbi:MAG TPA: cysteine--tRNA ligase, partial [Beijerinckiaceae bacterium]|nr:cysteine--tRNA ligase [Beijerinckiaceae bacterium]
DTPVMANVWMHNGFLQVEGEKMSKSAGNFVTIHELLHSEKFGGQLWSGPVLRLAMLRTHYRQPIDFTSKALEDARKKLDAWMRAARLALDGEAAAPEPSDDLVAALADDLNTHSALTSLDRLFNTTGDGQSDAHRQLGADLVFLGLASRSELKKPHAGFVSVDVDKVQALIDARLAARAAKNWAESDRLRDELVAMSITLKDNKDGTTTWEVKR